MDIYITIIEAVPDCSNPEREQYAGAYINCWVRAKSEQDAISRAMEYIDSEHWRCIQLEEISVAERSRYADLPDSLACFDAACEQGIAALFHIWLNESV